MITYKTYQEAKIANPDGAILKSKVRAGVFKLTSGKECMSNWCGCNPADYCMTIGAFLHSGYKFVVGDICINTCGLAEDVNSPWSWNAPSKEDSDRYVLKSAALEQQMNDKQETVLATEMSERDIPDFEGMAGVFDACASNEIDDDVKGFEINANGTAVSFDLIDNAPQQVESLSTTPKPDNNNKEMSDCIDSIASQLGLLIGFDVGYADLPYKLATHIADLTVGVECELKDGDIAYDADGNEIKIINTNMIYGLDSTGTFDYWGYEDLSKSKPESPQDKAKREREENGKALFELKVSLVPIPCFDWEDQAESSRESWRQLAELVTLKDEHKE